MRAGRAGSFLAAALFAALPVTSTAAQPGWPAPDGARSAPPQRPPIRDSLACRRRCEAPFPERARNPGPVQACLIRCSAEERHLARQNQRGTPEATGRGTPASPGTGFGVPVAPGAGLSAGVPQTWRPSPGNAPRTIAAYAGPPPSRSLALSEAVPDRVAAHRSAETACFQQNANSPCRLLTETQERCLAVAQGYRANALAVTADPRTFTVLYWGAGGGADQATAERAAMADCAGRGLPAMRCRVVAARCAG